MKTLFATLLASGLAAAPALAQVDQPPTSAPAAQAPAVVASQPSPDTARPTPGVPGDQAVNPAPGATGPYVGHGQHAFYDVDARIADIGRRVAALPASQRQRAEAGLKSIRAEAATQKARHGELRDWDRENLNYRLDQLVGQFPALSAQAQAQAGPQPQR